MPSEPPNGKNGGAGRAAPAELPPWDPVFPLRILPLGGVGEIGMNNMIYETREAAILVDCGAMFPEADLLGIDLVIPDWTALKAMEEKLIALVITHGHEDHIGAIPFFLREFPRVPIYATRFTRALIEARLKEHALPSEPRIIEVGIGEKFRVGPFGIHYLRVNHSIPDACSLAISTDLGVWIHTGDFKIDPSPPPGEHMDFAAFAGYGRDGVLALLSDSTNVDRPGYSISEQEVGRTIHGIFARATGRVILSTFSSNIYRIQQVINAAHAQGRKLVVDGRSMIRNVEIAAALGYLHIPEAMEIRPTDIDLWPHDRILMLTTGSQGEPMSSLVRMASDDHKLLTIAAPDMVILSSKFIPGNERAIHHLINRLCRKGAEVIFEKVSEVHVSGHASREELKMMINLVRPKFFIPVHGEYRHLIRHAQLASGLGIEPANTAVIENGTVLGVSADRLQVLGQVTIGRVFVDGKGVGDVEDMVLRDRKHLAQDGIVVALLNMDHQDGRLLGDPLFISRGFAGEAGAEAIFEEARLWLIEEIRQLPWEMKTDPQEFREIVRRQLGRFFRRVTDRRPMVIPVVSEM